MEKISVDNLSGKKALSAFSIGDKFKTSYNKIYNSINYIYIDTIKGEGLTLSGMQQLLSMVKNNIQTFDKESLDQFKYMLSLYQENIKLTNQLIEIQKEKYKCFASKYKNQFLYVRSLPKKVKIDNLKTDKLQGNNLQENQNETKVSNVKENKVNPTTKSDNKVLNNTSSSSALNNAKINTGSNSLSRNNQNSTKKTDTTDLNTKKGF